MEILGYSILIIVKILFSAFNGVLFAQSGSDKVFNYQSNLDYFKDHFKRSPLASSVGLLLPVIMLFETTAGLTSLAGVFLLLIHNEWGNSIAALGMCIGGLSLVSLFLGQRLAKDYTGAAVLVSYFLMTMAGLALYAF